MFDWVIGFVARHGYSAVFVLMFLENVFPPIPSEVVMPLAGYVAARGGLSFFWVVVAGSAGSLAGATLWYLAARKLGNRRLRRFVKRHGKWAALNCDDVDRASAWFDRHGRRAVFAGRLVPAVRTLIGVPAGFMHMPFGTYMVYSTAGTVIWTTVLVSIGWVLGESYGEAGKYIDTIGDAVLFAAVAYMIYRYIRQWRAASE